MGPTRIRAGRLAWQLASLSCTIFGGLPISFRGPRRLRRGQTIPFREAVSRPATRRSAALSSRLPGAVVMFGVVMGDYVVDYVNL